MTEVQISTTWKALCIRKKKKSHLTAPVTPVTRKTQPTGNTPLTHAHTLTHTNVF